MNACYYTHCPSCGAVAIETTLEELRDELAQHIRAEHPDVYVSTRLLDHAMQEAVYYPGSQESKEPKATPSPKEPSAPTKPAAASTYVFTCPICGTFMGAPTYKDLVKSVEQHLSHKHITSLSDVKFISDEFYSGLPEDYCAHLLGYSLAHTDDPENPVVPLDTTLPKNQWDLNGAVKPPIGIQPEYLWREHRMYDLIACINRYHESGFPVDPEWLEELRSLLVGSHFLSALKEIK